MCSNVYPTSTFYSDSINLDLASLSLFIRITYDCFHDDLKQVVWDISAIEGTTNNDCHQNIFQTAALSLTWNTEVRIQPICYSNPLGKFIHSYSSTSPKISLQHFLSQAKSEWSPMASSVSELCCNRSGRSLFSSFYT